MELTDEQRLEFIKIEMTLLQGVFHKYDDMVFRNRNWFVTLWMATIGIGLSSQIPIMILMACFLAILYWIIEGTIRYQYWYKYVIRYRYLRDTLTNNPARIEKTSLYDLTHHYATEKPPQRKRLIQSFCKLEPMLLYFALGVAALILWKLTLMGIISLPKKC